MFIAALFTIARTWKQRRCSLTDEWMNEEDVIYIQNGILLHHKKERIWVSSSEVDEPRAYYTQWSESEREKQISYINACTWDLENWYWWTYLQGRKRGADVEKRDLGTQRGKERVGRVERVALTHTHYHVWSRWPVGSRPTAQEAQLSAPWWPRGVGWGCMRKAQGGDLGTAATDTT